MHIVKEHDERRNEFLDTALALFMERGYEQTSVNAIIDAVGVSKGAFYHYFRTKEELVDQLAKRAAQQALAAIQPVVDDATMDAVAKLNEVFARSNALKAQNRGLIITLFRVFYSDANILLRKRLEERNVAAVAPILARIFEQGNSEGSMHVDHPAEAAAFVLRIGSSLVEEIARIFPRTETDPAATDEILRHLRMYSRSVERILGTGEGSLVLVDEAIVSVITGGDDD